MNLNEIYFALLNGLNVYWINTGYKVFIDNGKLCEINVYNGSMCLLQESQYQDCFVEGELKCS